MITLLGINLRMLYLSGMRIFVLLCLFTLPALAFSQARRALALIEKSKSEEAYELLNKALAKDSLASAEKYVLATLFFNHDYAKNNLDSAYHYILMALEAYYKTAEKSQAKHSSNGFDLTIFGQLKEDIEAEGFIRAKDGGKEQDYIDFLIEFSTSTQVDSAVILRNIEAFITAENTNSYQSYKHFIDTYPLAREVDEARKRYEQLLFTNKTKDGKLASYQQFLQQYPDTWHRKEAEQKIYNIITGRNSIAAYKQFVALYPQSFLKNQALIMHYSLLDDRQQEIFLASGVFTSHQIDSISLMQALNTQLIIPIIHDGEYQLIDAGNKVILTSLINVSDESKCAKAISNPALANSIAGKVLINLNGTVLARGEIVSFTDEGKGVIKIISTENQHFTHVSGARINYNNFNNSSIVWPYIAFQDKSKWGLESITGIPMLEPKYDSITNFHNHIILNEGKKWDILPVSYFYPLLDGGDLAIKLYLDNILKLSEEYLLLESGRKSSLVNSAGNTIVPMGEQSIELVDGGYFIDRIDSLLDSRVSDTWYLDLSSNEYWTIGDRGETKDIYYQGRLLMSAVEAKSLGLSAALITVRDSTFCYFNHTTKILLNEDESIRPIGKMGQNSSMRHFVFTNAKNEKTVYSTTGQQVDVGKYDKLLDIGDAYILSRIKKSYNLLNDNGKVVLPGIDAATSLDNGYISYLSDKKFGLFNEFDSTLIEAKYDKPLTTYSDSLFVTIKESKYGIINRSDSLIVPANYHEIRYMNDTVAILNRNFRWSFWDISHRKSLLDNVSDYWVHEAGGQKVYKIFKGIGYGIWSPESGTILNPTFSEISIVSKGNEVVYIAEKWVDEADIVIMLYYNDRGGLFRKEVLSTAEYEDLTCKTEQQ
jgi:hypothetical protein